MGATSHPQEVPVMLPARTMIASGALLAASLITASAAQVQTVWYVNDDGDAANGCASWLDACPELQTALSLANPGDQIWVAEGTYRPDYDVNTGQHTGDRQTSFHLISGVALYGGFDGTEEVLADRAGLFDDTILTGDLLDNDGPDFTNNDDNSYHVVMSIGADDTAILDGFAITGGNADGDSLADQDRGGGMYNVGSRPTVANCRFEENAAGSIAAPTSSCCYANSSPGCDDPQCADLVCDQSPECCKKWGQWDESCAGWAEYLCSVCSGMSGGGGGLYNDDASDATLTNCTFNGNSADLGGGMYNDASSPTLSSCTFSDNSAGACFPNACFGGGAGMFNTNGASPTLISCSFSENTAPLGNGGGMYNVRDASPVVADSTFSANSAYEGGGMRNDYSESTVTNCTFSENTAERGGGVYCTGTPTLRLLESLFTGNHANHRGGGLRLLDGRLIVTDCRFSGNTANLGGGISIYLISGTHRAHVIGCTFTGNEASSQGGGMHMIYGHFGSTNIYDCAFVSNTASGPGGGLWIHGPLTVARTLFLGNTSGTFGGGVFAGPNLPPSFVDCAFVGNTAASAGGGLVNLGSGDVTNCTFVANTGGSHGGGLTSSSLQSTVANCVLWGNDPDQIPESDPPAVVRFSDVQGGWPGEGNINFAPLFVRNPDPGPDGQWGTEDDNYGDLRLLSGSPCIDSADNMAVPADAADLDGDGDTAEPIPFDLDGNPRFIDDPLTPDTGAGECPIVDMGAYEFQEGTTACCPADLDGDGTVGAADLALLLGAWGPCAECPADLDGDGQVAPFDLALLLGNWGPCS